MELEKLNIPKSKIKQLNDKGINSIEDLVRFLPKKYMDFRTPLSINQVRNEQTASILVIITYIYPNESKKKYLRVKGVDNYGAAIYITWFNNKQIEKFINPGHTYIVCGTIMINTEYNQIQIVNPMYISEDINKFKKIVSTYPKIKGISFEDLKKYITNSLRIINNQEYLEDEILKRFNLQHEMDALINIHDPKDMESIKKARRRLVFDSLFQYQFQLEEKNMQFKSKTDIKITEFKEVTHFLNKLPFKLTTDQSLVMRKLCYQLKDSKKINSLLTADVGAGKTVIAFLLMIILAENGYQSTLMAPTSVLAKQHYNELVELLKGTSFKTCFLGGKLKAREKKKVLESIKSGEFDMIIGTHAVIQKDVIFKNLGIAIIDEEHRFGVAQRNALIEKTKDIHYLTMSATPIPRSLALTMYGESIDILSISTMPNGRKPIKTAVINDKKRAYQFMYKQILNGHQCYFVCPLIEKSYAEAMENVDSVEDIYKEMSAIFRNTNVNIAMVTGKMGEDEVDEQINKFKKNEAQIMIATTVIEVGVNVPNATAIVINNAERFGLAQLHQLRGRVGRSDLQSYCILRSEKDSERLNVMTTTNNGFEIAEEDLKIRGSGNLIGEEQSGQNEFIDLMLNYPNLFKKIKQEIKEIYNNENRLCKYKNIKIKKVS